MTNGDQQMKQRFSLYLKYIRYFCLYLYYVLISIFDIFNFLAIFIFKHKFFQILLQIIIK